RPLSSVININRRPLVLAGIELRGVDIATHATRSSLGEKGAIHQLAKKPAWPMPDARSGTRWSR
ncbi:hypothetical protein, partial [Xanthomonas euvesicatoria]|uniref:hypothetical protein n=1 Tax=Xanthomonas euvesicatoria TaxID=456327 RepID=UPI001C48D174